MKYIKKFSINEIITIVMEEVRIEESRNIYGIHEETDYPRYIDDKLEKMKEEDFEAFMNIIEKVAEDIIEIKSGELNELKKCHEEIIYLANKYLNDFLEK